MPYKPLIVEGISSTRIDEITSRPTVLVAIQGMWIGDAEQLRDLPFSQCADDVDSLMLFTFHDPRMLIELVERRMVVDIGRYILGYTGSRREPPSFIISSNEMPYYVNLPWGRQVKTIRSIPEWATYSPSVDRGFVEGEGLAHDGWKSRSKIVSFKPPAMEDKLEEEDRRRIELLASSTVRGIELLYDDGKTTLLLSSETLEDMSGYWKTFKSVYGELDPKPVEDGRPGFLARIPKILGFV